MARTVKDAQLGTVTARSRLKAGRQPHFRSIAKGTVIGYQRKKGNREGRWILRRHTGSNKYAVIEIGRADDASAANGVEVLSFEQAETKARAMVNATPSKVANLTVRDAMRLYLDHKAMLGQTRTVSDVKSRGTVHILPEIGDLVISELTREMLQRWLAKMANAPAQNKPTNDGKPQYRPKAESDDERRARRASANRVWTMLRAILNYAFKEGHVASDTVWRRVEPFEEVEQSRPRHLSVAEAQRLVNAADPDFRALVQGALETGARYSELCRLKVHDFNRDAGTIAITKSKSGKARHVILSEQGTEFFRAHTAGRASHEVIFHHPRGGAWRDSDQKRPMQLACVRAKITPAVGFHQLRHTWTSLAIMNGMPLMLVSRNLGHVDTGMVEKHYGHLTSSFITEGIRSKAPRYDLKPQKKVVPLR